MYEDSFPTARGLALELNDTDRSIILFHMGEACYCLGLNEPSKDIKLPLKRRRRDRLRRMRPFTEPSLKNAPILRRIRDGPMRKGRTARTDRCRAPTDAGLASSRCCLKRPRHR